MEKALRRMLYRGPDHRALHEQFARRGTIDEAAPVRPESHIDIHAPVESVWSVLTNVTRWPEIDPSFRSFRLDADLAVDASARFVLNRFPIRCRFAVIEPHRRLAWTGTSLWFRAVECHLLEPRDDGTTRYTVTESFAGWLAWPLLSSRRLEDQHLRWMDSFKRAVETPPAA